MAVFTMEWSQSLNFCTKWLTTW